MTALVGGFWGGITFGLGFGLAFAIVGRLAGDPYTLTFRLPRPRELGPVFGFGIADAAGFGLMGWSAGVVTFAKYSSSRELSLGLAGGLAFGWVIGLFSLWATPITSSPSATPGATYRSDRRTSVILGITIGLAIGFVFTLAYEPVQGLETGVASGIGFGLAGAFTASLAFGQVPLVNLTELILTCRWQDRVRFYRLLEDACDRQVLRQAGTVHQFRHAMLQDRLATRYPPARRYASTTASTSPTRRPWARKR